MSDEKDPKDELEEPVAGETPAEDSSAAETVAKPESEDEAAKSAAGDPMAEAAEQVDEAAAEAAEPVAASDEQSDEDDDEEPAAEAKDEPADAAPAKPRRRRARAKADEGEAPAPAEPAKPARRRDQPQPPVEIDYDVVVSAQAKYVRTSARKARLVCDHIRGKDVVEARAILAFTPRRAAEPWAKLLESAVANAEHNHELVGEDLRILAVTADEGPTLKRFRPRAMGRATKIRKRTSHLTILLTPKES
jgi:ribosomal protein L22